MDDQPSLNPELTRSTTWDPEPPSTYRATAAKNAAATAPADTLFAAAALCPIVLGVAPFPLELFTTFVARQLEGWC
ncbi:hypothetical protein MSAN_00119400 [Mycena sanguinolenta]|uniref:Uncharacterized protein n=1 Tax=Mycena sanguinolenta TaxID=230812 RepID=A0A8H6ZGQ1_9AGAR|nr:hypothetical protein MSAN_00119400 [Mycena sanguinolenta]